jgi:hypothetical protein
MAIWVGGNLEEAAVSQSSIRDERLILVNPAPGPLLRKVTRRDRVVAIFTDPDLVAIVLFCALGTLLTVALIHSLPGWGGVLATAEQSFNAPEPHFGMLPKVTPFW